MTGADIPFLTVDGGGSGTRVRVLAPDGRTLAEASAGPSSLTLGIDQAWRNVSTAAAQAAGDAGLTSARGLRLWGAFAGAGVPMREQAFIAADPLGCADIVVMGDGRASLAGAFSGQPGAVLAIGTGVIALALRDDGTQRWSSGWGFPAGDEGGGAWIGCRAVGLMSGHVDGRATLSPGFHDRLGRVIGDDYVAIQHWLVDAGATKYATLAPVVLEAAAAGAADAQALLDAAATHCDRALHAVAPDGPAALLGGLGAPLTPYLSSATRARLQPPQGTALDGLRILALENERPAADFRSEVTA